MEIVEEEDTESTARNVEQMKDFGSRLGDLSESEEPVMNLEDLDKPAKRQEFLRQTDPDLDDNEIRCIPKLMQVNTPRAENSAFLRLRTRWLPRRQLDTYTPFYSCTIRGGPLPHRPPGAKMLRKNMLFSLSLFLII